MNPETGFSSVLHIVTNSDLGGAPRVVTELANMAVNEGKTVAVAAMQGGPMWESLDKRIARFPLRFIRRKINPVADWLCLLEIRRLLKKLKPNIIHAHSSKIGVLVRLAAGNNDRKRIVYTIHGFDTILKAHRIFLPLERFLAKRCGAIVPVSAYDEANLEDSSITGNIRLIHNGVTDRFGKEGFSDIAVEAFRKAKAQNKRISLSIARLEPPKRFDLFVRVAESLSDMAFFWIGNVQGQEEIEDSLGGPLPENLWLLGELPEAGNYCNYCDIFILLSDYEGLPMSILEAMSCGKPVITSDVGGINEAVNQDNGFLVTNNADEVKNLLQKTDDISFKLKGTVSKEKYKNNFSVNLMYQRYKKLYEELNF